MNLRPPDWRAGALQTELSINLNVCGRPILAIMFFDNIIYSAISSTDLSSHIQLWNADIDYAVCFGCLLKNAIWPFFISVRVYIFYRLSLHFFLHDDGCESAIKPTYSTLLTGLHECTRMRLCKIRSLVFDKASRVGWMLTSYSRVFV